MHQKCRALMFTHSKELHSNIRTQFSCLSQYFRIGIFMAPYKTKLFFSLSNCEYKFLTFFQSLLLILGQKFSSRFHVLFFYSKPIRTIWKVFIIIYGWQMHFSHQPTSVSTEWIPTFICLSQNKNIKTNVILKNCFFQNIAIKRDKNKLHRYNTIYSVI